MKVNHYFYYKLSYTQFADGLGLYVVKCKLSPVSD